MRPKLRGFHRCVDGLRSYNAGASSEGGHQWAPRMARPKSTALGITLTKGNKAAEEGKESGAEVGITKEREEAEVRVAGIRDSGNILPGREQRTDTDASNAASFLRAGIKIILSLPLGLVLIGSCS